MRYKSISRLPVRGQLILFLILLFLYSTPPDLAGQQMTVRGTVTDSSEGFTLPSVNIIEKGTTRGAISDSDGYYEITVSGPAAVLVFSFVGYVAREISLDGRTLLDVELAADFIALQETVVIGYGVQRRDDLTGSIAVVDVDDLTRMNAVSFDRALQGRAAGVHVTSTSGRPGAPVSVKIRGIGSISRSSEPLFIVDGVALTQGGINSINPNDIESVQILKDASATAIYGTRGANGVVVITTKKGVEGKPQVNYSANYISSRVPRVFEVLNADQYSQFTAATWGAYSRRENIPDNRNLYLTVYSPEARNTRNNSNTSTDWQDALTQSGVGQNHSLSVRGGTPESSYYVAGNYYTEDGTMVNTGFDRMSLRANSEFQVHDRVRIGQTASVSHINNILESHHINFQPWSGVLVSSPLMPLYDPGARGGYGGPTDTLTGGNERTNVIAEQMLNQNTSTVNHILASGWAEVRILEGLTYSLRAGGEYYDTYTRQWSPQYTLGNMKLRDMDISRLQETSSYGQIWQLGNFLEYSGNFGSHNVTTIIGHERTRDYGFSILAGGRDIAFDELDVLDQALTGERIGGSRGEERLESALFRVLYDYGGKYLVTASIRRDGSSKFAPANRIGYFPSFSIGWRVNEDLFPQVSQITMMKLRVGWGQTGNSNIPRYQYLELIDPFIHTRYTFGRNQDLYLGGAPITFQSSRQIQWEATEMTNFGLDLNMFRAKVQFTAEYYIKNQDNMLVQKPISVIFGKRVNYGTGWPTVGAWMNLARVQNRGLELNLLYREFDRRFRYSVNANFSTLKNTIVDLGVGEFASGLNYARNGHTIGSFYGYVAERILQVEDFMHDENGNPVTDNRGNYTLLHAFQETGTSPGDIKFKDLNGDGIINDLDRTIIGKPLPDFIYGLDIQMEYGQWDFGFFINGMHNLEVYNGVYSAVGLATDSPGKDENKLVEVLNYWTPENRSNTMTRPYVIDPNRNNRTSTWFLEDASFLRIRNIQLGYTFPGGVSNRAGIGRIRIYGSVNNLFTITGYRGYDPEVGSQNPLNTGIDNGNYPVPRTMMFGVQLDI
jgi:TonB-dependent starch-binding outer membrane protein SusC